VGLQIVLDTNVLISALRSRRGASFKLLSLVGKGSFEVNISVPLALEYEDVAKRQAQEIGLTEADVDDVLDFMCRVANRRRIFFLWRPFLRDPKDDHVLVLAVEANCQYVVTHNVRDFAGVEQFGVEAITPQVFLRKLGVIT
jgi:putative PIN family toxin of toxin-antitoxin system